MVAVVEGQVPEIERLLLRVPQVTTVYDLIGRVTCVRVELRAMDSVNAWFNRQPRKKSN